MRRVDVIAVVAVVAELGCHVDPPLPPVPSCPEVASHVYALMSPGGAHARAVAATMERRCDVDFWSERTRTCLAEEPALDGQHKCRDTLTAPQRTQLATALAALDAPAATSVSAITDPDCPPTVVEECAAVCDALAQVAQCYDMAPQARVMLKQSWVHAMAIWATQPVDVQRRVCIEQLHNMQRSTHCQAP